MSYLSNVQRVINKYYKIESEDNILHIFSLCNTVIFFIILFSFVLTLLLRPWIVYFNFVFGSLISVYFITFILIRRGYYLSAQTFFLSTSILLITLFTLCVGNKNGFEFALIIYLIVSAFIYKKAKYTYLITSLCVSSYFFTEIYFYLGNPTLIEIPPSLPTKILLFTTLLFALTFLMNYVMGSNRYFRQRASGLLLQYKAQNQLLEEANGELETFTHIASHDLRSPLRNINNFTELIERRIKQEKYDETYEFIGFIKTSVSKMVALLEDLLNLARVGKIEQKDFSSVNLQVLVAEICVYLRTQIKEKNAQINFPELPTINSVNSQLFVVFKNLIENGIKYNQSHHPTINITYQQSDENITLHISDNGIGIPQEHKDTIFKMFERLPTEQAFQGTGMGLAITKKIIDRLGGSITLGKQEQGSLFIVQLPN